jgi:PAS domain-containing protein
MSRKAAGGQEMRNDPDSWKKPFRKKAYGARQGV